MGVDRVSWWGGVVGLGRGSGWLSGTQSPDRLSPVFPPNPMPACRTATPTRWCGPRHPVGWGRGTARPAVPDIGLTVIGGATQRGDADGAQTGETVQTGGTVPIVLGRDMAMMRWVDE